MPIVMALDASLRVPSCALRCSMGTLLTVGAEGASEEFAPVVRLTLQEAGITLADVDEIAVSAGPGSYMGVRAAVATANAFAFATGKNVTSVDSLHAVAAAADYGDRPTVAIPAGRGRYFVASYERTATGLARDGPSELLDQFTTGGENVVATPPRKNGPTVGAPSSGIVLSALSVLRVLEEQPQLVLNEARSRATPILPPPTIGRPA